MTEDEMVGWHHQLNEHEFEQTPGDGEGKGSLVSCSPWGHKGSDMTYRLDSNNNPEYFPGACEDSSAKPKRTWEKTKRRSSRNMQVGSGIKQRLEAKFKSQHSLILIQAQSSLSCK